MQPTLQSFIVSLAIAVVLLASVCVPVVFAEDALVGATETTQATSTESAESSESSTSQEASTSSTISVEELHQTAESTTSSTQNDNESIIASSTSAHTLEELVFDIASTSIPGEFVTVETTTTSPGNVVIVSTNDPASTTPLNPTEAATSNEAATSTVAITTGDAFSLANILNIVNTTFINSEGAIVFANYTDEVGSIDVRGANIAAGLCSGTQCAGLQGVEVRMGDEGYIDNEVLVSAHTGDNALANVVGSGAIRTGDAFAGLNLVNMANVLFADARYFMLTLNAFRGIGGDVVMPGLYNFFQEGNAPSVEWAGAQSGTITNEIGTAAGTGGNNAQQVGNGSRITSGNSLAQTNVFNSLNNLFSGGGLSFLLRVSGEWNGEVIGLPEGLVAERTPEGIYIRSSAQSVQGTGSINATSTVTASIRNQALVEATTGDNSIASTSEEALIATGNAFAGANVINIANQTVLGRNWLLAIVNVFGDFMGNVVFGQPDLWVGATVATPGFVESGSEALYTISVKNNGDRAMQGVEVRSTIDASRATLVSASVSPQSATGTLVFSLGMLQPQEIKEITFTVRLHDVAPQDEIETIVTVSGAENDPRMQDNTERVAFRVSSPTYSGGGGITWVSPLYVPPPTPTPAATSTPTLRAPHFSVDRHTQLMVATPFAPSVSERLTLTHTATTTATNVVLKDVLTDWAGNVVHEELYALGEVVAGEEIVIEYALMFATSTQTGEYFLTTFVSANGMHPFSIDNGVVTYLLINEPATSTPFVGDVLGVALPTIQLLPGAFTPRIPTTTPFISAMNESVVPSSTLPVGAQQTLPNGLFPGAAGMAAVFILLHRSRVSVKPRTRMLVGIMAFIAGVGMFGGFIQMAAADIPNDQATAFIAPLIASSTTEIEQLIEDAITEAEEEVASSTSPTGLGLPDDIVLPFPVCELTVKKTVVGGTATSSDFMLSVDGDAKVRRAPGSFEGTTYNDLREGRYVIFETGPTGYTATFSGDCAQDGTVLLSPFSTKRNCTITNTFISTTTPPTGTSTPPTGTSTPVDGTLSGEVIAPTSTPNGGGMGGGEIGGEVIAPPGGGTLSGTVVAPGGSGGGGGGGGTSGGGGGGNGPPVGSTGTPGGAGGGNGEVLGEELSDGMGGGDGVPMLPDAGSAPSTHLVTLLFLTFSLLSCGAWLLSTTRYQRA